MARKSSPVSVVGGFFIILTWLNIYEGMPYISVRGVSRTQHSLSKSGGALHDPLSIAYLKHLSYLFQTKPGSISSSLTEVYQALTFYIISD